MSKSNLDCSWRFGSFELDSENRVLKSDLEPIGISSRYLDALILLVENHGSLVSKETFFSVVWNDVIVADSALTQAIKVLRSVLGDDANNPRFIKTISKHGYQFIADVESVEAPGSFKTQTHSAESANLDRGHISRLGAHVVSTCAWGVLGGCIAGVFGGILYASALLHSSTAGDFGTLSVFAVLITVNVIVGALGALGISIGLATASSSRRNGIVLQIVLSALGGFVVGGIIKLIGVDGFRLLVGESPRSMTGPLEGAFIGAFFASGLALMTRYGPRNRWSLVVGASITSAIAGILIPLLGGTLLGGSLNSLAGSFSGSQIELDALGAFFGELYFGKTSEVVFGAIEGLLFGLFVSSALTFRFSWYQSELMPAETVGQR